MATRKKAPKQVPKRKDNTAQKAAKKGSVFRAWFEAQFGKRRSNFPKKTDELLRSMVYMGRLAQHELDRREQYDAKETAALSAYSAFLKRY